MLRVRDLLLTLAAVCLLVASLDVRSRIIKASALGESGPRKSDENIDRLMGKIRRNLNGELKWVDVAPAARANTLASKRVATNGHEESSYNHYENKTKATSDRPNEQELGARRAAGGSGQRYREAQEVRAESLRSRLEGERRKQNSTLYLLNYLPQASPSPASAQQAESRADVRADEQQQQPAFTLLPPYNQQQQQQQQLAQNNLRQALNNYQRYSQNQQQLSPELLHQLRLLQRPAQSGAAGADQNQALLRSLLQPQQPAQTQTNNSSQQQALSPLHLLRGPLQALLPGFNQNQNVGQSQSQNQDDQRRGSKGVGGQSGANAQLPALFNPFLAGAGQQQQQQPLPALHALYQQLPIYQALLAARQRQEALEAAQKVRQQQQQQHQQQLLANLQPAGPNLAHSPRPSQPADFRPPQQQLPLSPPASTEAPVAGGGAQRPNEAPVSFDDDEPKGDSRGSDNNGDDQTNTQPESEQNRSDEQSQQNNERQENGGGGANAEQDDPDLKQFQNLANGGDSFTDLFPPGILSNNDISEIKRQQESQAKKQEEEEERKRQQQQQQQRPTQAEQPVDRFASGGQPQQVKGEQQQPPPPAASQEQPADDEGGEGPADSGGGGGGDQEEGGGGGGEGQGEGGGEDEGESPTAAALTAQSERPATRSPGVEYAAGSAAGRRRA